MNIVISAASRNLRGQGANKILRHFYTQGRPKEILVEEGFKKKKKGSSTIEYCLLLPRQSALFIHI